eukprot:CAMPEP_0197276374 /NCGR_PEP_ID=MMETSP1432-20130617/15243_1 /TAXON_ID=44447 /ORGANISM="Pseudo-nitzschia delicatissima, Strain UNC1205" /LENGTH=296 /DNA_ID=CAMNT_0042742409 /DNA_START=209 /DNA_END=1098 /DNA_ORIENTATION=+
MIFGDAMRIVATVAASPLRETVLVLLGIGMGVLLTWILSSLNQSKASNTNNSHGGNNQKHTIRTIEDLREIMPAGKSGTSLLDAPNVRRYLDDQMIAFIDRSPLLYLATVDSTTKCPFVSPKGDKPGFVSVLWNQTNDDGNTIPNQKHTLVIPDRPGNRQLLEFKTSCTSPKRPFCSKSRRTERPSAVEERPASRPTQPYSTVTLPGDAPPKVVILVDIDYAFFHCALAYMRSEVWDPTSWPSKPLKISLGKYYSKKGGPSVSDIDSTFDDKYRMVQNAIDGAGFELEMERVAAQG